MNYLVTIMLWLLGGTAAGVVFGELMRRWVRPSADRRGRP